jgi:hypothetical protein
VGDKNQLLVEGDHNSARPPFFYDSASIFFHNALLSAEEQGASCGHPNTRTTFGRWSVACARPKLKNAQHSSINGRAEETMKVAEALEGTSSGGDSYRSPRVVPDVSADYDPSMEDMEDEMLRQALLLSLQDCTSPYEMCVPSSFFFILHSSSSRR